MPMLSYPTASAAARVEPGPGERVQDDTLPQWQDSADQLSEKGLRFQARMRCKGTLVLTRRSGLYHVPKRFVLGGAPETAGLPLTQIVLHSPLDGPPEDDPGLPHRTRHHAHLAELLVSGLRPVAAPHGHDQSGDAASALHAGLFQRTCHDMDEEGIRGDNDVRTRDEPGQQEPAPEGEELAQLIALLVGKDGEPRQRGTRMAVEGGRNSPHAPHSLAHLQLLLGSVLMQSVRRVRDDGMNAVVSALLQPGEAVTVDQCRSTEEEGLPPWLGVDLEVALKIRENFGPHPVDPAFLPDESFGRLQPQARPNRRPGRRPDRLGYPFSLSG